MCLITILGTNFLFNLSVFPRGIQVEFASAFKLFLGFDVRVENPLTVMDGDVRFHGFDSLVEDFDLLIRELSVEHFEVVPEWIGEYTRERRLPMKRLLFR